MMYKLLFVVALMGLTACGNQGGSSISAVVKGAASSVLAGGDETPVAPDLDAQIAQLANQGSAALRIEIPNYGSLSGAVPLLVNNGKVTWVAGASSLTTQSGFVLATRGLPEDLLAVEVEGFGAALTNGGTYQRQMEWLNGRNEAVRASFSCQISVVPNETVAVLRQSYITTLYNDHCRGDSVEFTNKYWIGSDRKLRQSQQWISVDAGYIQTQRISQ